MPKNFSDCSAGIRYLFPKQWDCLTGWLKKQNLVTRWLLALLVLLICFILFVRVGDSQRTPFALWIWPESPSTPSMSIQPMARTKLSEWAQDRGSIFNKNKEYFLLLEFEARFRSERFNDSRTLHSLKPYGQVGGVWHRDFSTSSGMARWISQGSFDTLPKQLTVSIGGVTRPVPLDQIQWHEFQHTTSRIGGATVQLVLNDPDWIVLSSARLVPTSESPAEWFLELELRNNTEDAVIANEITLESQLLLACSLDSLEYQSILLDWRTNEEWPKWVDNQWVDDGLLKLSALTSFADDMKLKVSVVFEPASCNEYNVTVHAPINLRVTPEDSPMSYGLRIKEIEVSEEDRMQMANSPEARGVPPKLPQLGSILASHYHDIRISVTGTYPRGLRVRRPLTSAFLPRDGLRHEPR